MKTTERSGLTAQTIVGVTLIAFAGLMWWETRLLPTFASHGLGAAALPRLIGAGLAVLGVLHVVSKWRTGGTAPSRAATVNIFPALWIGAGLVLLALIIEAGGGFIPAIAVLFAAASRAFGRRGILVDLALGGALALGVYLIFVELLDLTLPTGPLESLL